MFKELDKISTLGFVNQKVTGMDLWNALWKEEAKHHFHFGTTKDILNAMIDSSFKKVDERLLPLIGVYELPIVAQPYWVEQFINQFTSYATLENLLITKRYNPINAEVTCADFYDSLADMTTSLKEANFAEGTMKDKQGRNVKILKYIKQQLNKFVVISDTDFEKEEFVKYYIKYKESKNRMYLVITNSIASILGMSSYAPQAQNDRGRLWTSCMTGSGGTVPAQVIPNIYDEGSLICYVTDGLEATHSALPNDKKFTHHAMLSRTMLRLLVDGKDKNPTIVLDRGYPHSMYTEATYIKLAELIQGTELSLGIFSQYNTTQNGKNVFGNMVNKYTQGCYMTRLIQPKETLTVLNANCTKTSCGGCRLLTINNVGNANHCDMCVKSRSCDKKIDCRRCNEYERNSLLKGSSWYDDQCSSRASTNDDRKVYNVYTHIEKNIQLPKKAVNE